METLIKPGMRSFLPIKSHSFCSWKQSKQSRPINGVSMCCGPRKHPWCWGYPKSPLTVC